MNRIVNVDGHGVIVNVTEDPAERADHGEILSDVLQSVRCILIDVRAEHMKPQVSSYGMTIDEAKHELENAIKALDALEQQS